MIIGYEYDAMVRVRDCVGGFYYSDTKEYKIFVAESDEYRYWSDIDDVVIETIQQHHDIVSEVIDLCGHHKQINDAVCGGFGKYDFIVR